MVQANKYDIDWISILYLELVDELVNDLPQPLVGQLKVDRGVGRQDVVEQLAVVVVALKPLLNSWASLKIKYPIILPKNSGKDLNLHPGVDVAEVQLPEYVRVAHVT